MRACTIKRAPAAGHRTARPCTAQHAHAQRTRTCLSTPSTRRKPHVGSRARISWRSEEGGPGERQRHTQRRSRSRHNADTRTHAHRTSSRSAVRGVDARGARPLGLKSGHKSQGARGQQVALSPKDTCTAASRSAASGDTCAMMRAFVTGPSIFHNRPGAVQRSRGAAMPTAAQWKVKVNQRKHTPQGHGNQAWAGVCCVAVYAVRVGVVCVCVCLRWVCICCVCVYARARAHTQHTRMSVRVPASIHATCAYVSVSNSTVCVCVCACTARVAASVHAALTPGPRCARAHGCAVQGARGSSGTRRKRLQEGPRGDCSGTSRCVW